MCDGWHSGIRTFCFARILAFGCDSAGAGLVVRHSTCGVGQRSNSTVAALTFDTSSLTRRCARLRRELGINQLMVCGCACQVQRHPGRWRMRRLSGAENRRGLRRRRRDTRLGTDRHSAGNERKLGRTNAAAGSTVSRNACHARRGRKTAIRSSDGATHW